MSYTGPWRNRLHGLYTQYAFIDELKSCDPKLVRILEIYSSAFDDEWFYRIPKRRDPTTREAAIRMPVYMESENKFKQKGDFGRRLNDSRGRDKTQRRLIQ